MSALLEDFFESIAVFDLDDTLLKKNCSKCFFLHLLRKKVFSKWLIFFYMIYYFRYRYMDKSLDLLHKRVFHRFLKGRDFSQFEEEAKLFWKKNFTSLIRGSVLERLLRAKDNKGMIVILSCSPEFLIKPLAERLGVFIYKGCKYKVDSKGNFEAIDTIIYGESKAEYVEDLKKKYRLSKVVAYTDCISDLPLLKTACHPVCVKPKRKLASLCKKNNWETIRR